MSTTDHTSEIERVARQHAEAALCHLAHVAGITFGDAAFDTDRDQLAKGIASYLTRVEGRARGVETSEEVLRAAGQLEDTVATFGRIDRANVSSVLASTLYGYVVGVSLYRMLDRSDYRDWTFESRDDAEAFRVTALEIVESAT